MLGAACKEGLTNIDHHGTEQASGGASGNLLKQHWRIEDDRIDALQPGMRCIGSCSSTLNRLDLAGINQSFTSPQFVEAVLCLRRYCWDVLFQLNFQGKCCHKFIA